MSRTWPCPVCGSTITVSEVTGSIRVRCPSCDTEFTVPLRKAAAANRTGSGRDENNHQDD